MNSEGHRMKKGGNVRDSQGRRANREVVMMWWG